MYLAPYMLDLNGCIIFTRGSSNEFRSDEELADEMIESIIECAEKEDAKALTGLFSQYAEENTLNLTEQAEDFIEFFKANVKAGKEIQVLMKESEHGEKSLA